MNDKLNKGDLRRAKILDALKQKGELSLNEITEQFTNSEATARRDLRILAETERIIRTIGGAYYDGGSLREMPFFEKQSLLLEEKSGIARLAASLIQEGDIIGLTGGTTTYHIAKAIKTMKNITVVTNAVNIAMELAPNDDIQTVLTGGVIRSKSFELCGPLAESIVEKLNIGKMFVGIDGFSLDSGLTTYSELEAHIGKLMVSRARHVIAVFDHTKVNHSSLFTIAPITSIHECITDLPLASDMQQELEALNISMHYSLGTS